jgi:hypothetical protein
MFEDDGRNALQMQQLGQQQSRWTCSDNADLCAHTALVSSRSAVGSHSNQAAYPIHDESVGRRLLQLYPIRTAYLRRDAKLPQILA